MIKTCSYILTFLVFFSAAAQTGPAGVGTSSSNVFWIRADAGTSSTTNNTPISSWADQSGNAIDMTQTVSTQQPSFATNVINGFPAVLFDNNTTNNDKMLGADSPLLDNTSGYSFFTVSRPLNLDGTARSIVCKRTGVSIDQSFMLFYYTTNKLYIDIQTTDNRFASNTTYASNTNYLTSLIYDGSVSTASRCALYNEETFDRYATETNTLVPDNNSPILIGSTDAGDNRPFGGYIAEVIIYRTALNAAQRIILNNYLSAKYNIALSANDRYAGDNSGNGDYDRQVAGIGQEATGSNPSFSASVTGGLTMSANSGLDNGDYILVGHAVATNTTITTDVGGMTGSNRARWQRVWYVDVTNASTNMNINIEFDMSDGGMAPFTPGTLSDYVLLYRAGQTGNWLEVATASAISGDRIIFNSQAATGDGYVTIGTRNFHNSPLPVTLLDFKAEARGQSVELSWSAATQKNNDYFTVERSQDGVSFEPITKTKGAGTTSMLLSYRSSDDSPLPGTSYYRLKQTDFDGSFSYSGIVEVSLATVKKELLLFPNPTTGDFKIGFPDAQAKEIRIALNDVTGRQILSELLLTKADDGLFLVTVPPGIAAGTYLLTARYGEHAYSHKLVIR